MNKIILLLEVMDKEPTILIIWIVAVIVGVSGFILCKYNLKFYLLYFAISMVFGLGFYGELNDEFVGPAIRQEAGWGYVYQSYLAILIAAMLPIVGSLVGYNQRRRLTSRSS